MKKALLIAGLIGASAVAVRADTLALWTFETSQPAGTGLSITASPESGSGLATGSHTNASTAFASFVGNGSAHSMSADHWGIGDYWQFQTSTTGFQDVHLSYDQTGSATGPKSFDLSYSTDGSTFTLVGNFSVLQNGATPNASWNSATAQSAYNFGDDLSSITALNNASSVYFRLTDSSTVSINNGTVGTGGTDRIDNFAITANPVPEPSSLFLLGGLGVLAIALARRHS